MAVVVVVVAVVSVVVAVVSVVVVPPKRLRSLLLEL